MPFQSCDSVVIFIGTGLHQLDSYPRGYFLYLQLVPAAENAGICESTTHGTTRGATASRGYYATGYGEPTSLSTRPTSGAANISVSWTTASHGWYASAGLQPTAKPTTQTVVKCGIFQ